MQVKITIYLQLESELMYHMSLLKCVVEKGLWKACRIPCARSNFACLSCQCLQKALRAENDALIFIVQRKCVKQTNASVFKFRLVL